MYKWTYGYNHDWGTQKDCLVVTGMKTTKIIRFLTKMNIRVDLIPNLNFETRKTRPKTRQVQENIQKDFIIRTNQNRIKF